VTSILQNNNNQSSQYPMNSVIQQLNTNVIPAIALDCSDECWASTVGRSGFGRVCHALANNLLKYTTSLANIGSNLELGGFGLVSLMLLIIAAQQFANDKGMLAIIVIAAMSLRILGALFSGREKFRASAIDAVVLLYFGVNVVASFASHYLAESIYGLSKLIVYVIAYYLFLWCLQTKTKSRAITLLTALMAGALLVSLYGLYQYKTGVAPLATWEDPSVEDKTTRVFSTLGNPNLLAGYLIPIIPVGFCLSVLAVFNNGWKRWLAVPMIGSTLIIVLATVLTGSRGAYLALIAELAIISAVSFALLWKNQPRARIPVITGLLLVPAIAAIAIHFGSPTTEHRFLSIFSGSEHSSNAYRMNVYAASLAMFKDNWWIGIGTGNKTFEQAYGLYMHSGFDALGTYCVPLEIGVETGIPGLFAFGWLLLVLAAKAHRRFWNSTDNWVRWLAVGAIAAIAGMMVHGLVDTVFYRPQVQFIFWLTVSLIVALPSGPDQAGGPDEQGSSCA
jgi:putative inorganic carbon (HCO3(-)) transporter